MVRHSAENQRRYREKLKARGPEYLARERKRVHDYYVPTVALSHTDAEKRRARARKSMSKTRLARRQVQSISIPRAVQEPPSGARRSLRLMPHSSETRAADRTCGTSGALFPRPVTDLDCPSCSGDTSSEVDQPGRKLMVKFKFKAPSHERGSPKDQSRKRINRTVMCYKRKNASLQTANYELQREVWRLKKAVQRTQTRTSPLAPSKTSNRQQSTPVKEANKLMRSAGLSPRKVPLVTRALVHHHATMKCLKTSGAKACRSVIKSTKGKSRSTTYIAKKFGISRKITQSGVKKTAVRSAVLRRAVHIFLQRDDNSTCLPGKRDVIKVGKEKIQRYILNGCLRSLHDKFLSENPDKQLSLAFFCRCRPKNIMPISYASRKVCLCLSHQNVALKLRALKSVTPFPCNPDTFAKLDRAQVHQALDNIDSEHIRYKEWQRIGQPFNDKIIKRTTLTEVVEEKAEFVTKFKKKIDNFKLHNEQVITQYEQIRLLKATLPENHVIVQLDFAENYVCNYNEEVSSAYYSKVQVTIHPAVLHFRRNDVLHHQSFALLSDETAHNAGTVYSFVKHLVPKIKETVPNVETIHYLSDSPTSQYRNANIINMTAMHSEFFGISATWQYYESGHGKGPCDGVGGAVKRSADLAVKQGILIQNAYQFFQWGDANITSQVRYLLITKEEVKKGNDEMLSHGAVRIPGTMKLHSVMPKEDNIYTRDTTCFSSCCWSEGQFHPTCDGWTKHTKTAKRADAIPEQTEPMLPIPVPAQSIDHIPIHDKGAALPIHDVNNLQLGVFVAALYDRKLYIGVIEEEDNDDNEFLISFMEKCGHHDGFLKWPKRKDCIWVGRDNIVKVVHKPITTGKSMRMYRLNESDMESLDM